MPRSGILLATGIAIAAIGISALAGAAWMTFGN